MANDDSPKPDSPDIAPKIDPTKGDSLKDKLNPASGLTAGGVASKVVGSTSETGAKAVETVEKTKRAVEATKAAAAAVKGAAAAVAPILTSWVFWVVVLAIAVVTALVISVIAASQTFGRNENARGCLEGPSAGSGMGAPAVASEDQVATSNSIAGWLTTTKFDFLGGKPFSVNMAFGVIGNWSQESGLRPTAIQNGAAKPTDSNDVIAAISGGGKAVGLAQWDGGRRTALANFATQQGGSWSDINVQLAYFKHELEGAEGQNLIAGGFNDSSKTVTELVIIFEERFERAGIPMMDNRIEAGNYYFSQYNGGYSSAEGGSCLTAMEFDPQIIVDLAAKLSYATLEESVLKPGDSTGEASAKSTYVEAKNKAMSLSADSSPSLYASGDRFIATVLKLTIDSAVPWGNTAQQYKYLSDSPQWEMYTDQSKAKAGDIWISQHGGHAAVYLGKYGGQPSIAHAKAGERVAGIGTASWISGFTDPEGRKYVGFSYNGGNQTGGEGIPAGKNGNPNPPGGNGRIPAEYLCPLPWSPKDQVICAAYSSVLKLNEAYKANFGTNMTLNDSYRDYAGQVEAKRVYGNMAAEPGTSNHGWGKALDIGGGVATFFTPQYNWMKANAGKFGWIHPAWAEPGGRLPEPWHWEWAG